MLSFIDKFKSSYRSELEDVFCFGWCYYFSVILRERFDGEICYLPIKNHFVCRIGDLLYDITGVVTAEEEVYSWEEYKHEDELHADHITRDCIMK